MYDGPEFRHLQYFIAVAEQCHFGRAAQQLHVSQPALSAQIIQLEDRLRARLFLRGPRGVSLTHAGRAFLPFARQMLKLCEDAVHTTSSVHSGVGLSLRFGYSPFVHHTLIGGAIEGYQELVPNSPVRPSSECSASLVDMVVQGRLDAALISMPIAERDLSVHHICTEKIQICLRHDDPLANAETVSREAVGRRLRVFFNRSHHPPLYDEIMFKLRQAGISVGPTDFVSAPFEMQYLVKIGVGWGIVRESVPLDPELVRRNIEGVPLRVKTAFVCHRTQQRPVLPLLAFRLAKMCAELHQANRRNHRRSIQN